LPSDLKRSKTPALPGLLEGCKQYALRDYARRGNNPKVIEDFYQSLVDAIKVSNNDRLLKDVALVSMIRSLRLDTRKNFESDVTSIVDHLKRRSERR
jgi:hypothetical protein